MTIHDDLLIEFKVKANINLESKDVWQSRDLSVDYLPGKKFYVLLEGDDDASVYGEARRVGASEEFTKHVAALALYSNKAYERITGSLFLKINTSISLILATLPETCSHTIFASDPPAIIPFFGKSRLFFLIKSRAFIAISSIFIIKFNRNC